MIKSEEELIEMQKSEYAKLLERIQLRDEMAELLKIAQPEKIAEVRKIIADLDETIEGTEEVLQLIEKSIHLRRKYDVDIEELAATADIVLEGLREHLAGDPEKLELLEAMLEDDGKSH